MTGLAPARLARIAPLLAASVDRGELPGAVALVARGETAHVVTAGMQDIASATPMRRDTIFRIASMSKAIFAAAALTLVEEGRIALDDAIDRWLPELADRRVLRTIDGPLDDTVPARRPISLRDLLTLRFGLGMIMAAPGSTPLQVEIARLGLQPSASQIAFTPDDYLARMASLPLAHQPGERWLYHTGYDVLAVLMTRVTRKPLGEMLAERLFVPLGMADTGFHVPPGKIARLATAYGRTPDGRLEMRDAASGGDYGAPPLFPSELVSTADDYLAFARMLLARGRGPTGRVLSRASVLLMMTDQITPAQKTVSPFFGDFWENSGWGLGASVVTRRHDIAANPGAYGWSGGFGTNFVTDPGEGLTAILLTQRMMQSADDTALARTLFTMAYAAIDDRGEDR
jgi:CubicO group peptidase (beta-lactamase class C family)